MSKSITSLFKPVTDILNSDEPVLIQNAPMVDLQSTKSLCQSQSSAEQNQLAEIT